MFAYRGRHPARSCQTVGAWRPPDYGARAEWTVRKRKQRNSVYRMRHRGPNLRSPVKDKIFNITTPVSDQITHLWAFLNRWRAFQSCRHTHSPPASGTTDPRGPKQVAPSRGSCWLRCIATTGSWV
ncbi:hypothetical protein E2C01_062794 [Portunus trituberculatus]|uniref:Uncharacterized protein n=1 Tax=Portunus trituberculatus TaxID=210409 RepID=A0A5B7HC27_PORTR|nr:hypothetical protein [Portunus trituberculatus]